MAHAPVRRRSAARLTATDRPWGSRGSGAGKAALGNGDPGDQHRRADRLIPAQRLAEHERAERCGDDRDEVGHGRSDRRAGGADDRVVEDVSDAAAEHAEREQAADAVRPDVRRRCADERGEQREHRGRAQQLPRAQRDSGLRPTREVAARERPREAITHRRTRARRLSDQLAVAEAAPRAEDDEHAEEPDEQSGYPLTADVLVVEHDKGHAQHPQRRRRVPQPGEDRGDVLLAIRQQRERDRVEQQRRDQQVPPGMPTAEAQPLAAGVGEDEERQRAERDPPERDPECRPVLAEHLDEQEARAPDRGEQHELHAPVQHVRETARRRRL